jgi:prepilin-type processing-associated H-X9-DG protein
MVSYAAANRNKMISASTTDDPGGWFTQLEPHLGRESAALIRRCPDDSSPYFDQLFTGVSPPAKRTTSYAINGYVSPTHGSGLKRIYKITQVRQSSRVIQFAELAEQGNYCVSDHIHAGGFYIAALPQTTLANIAKQMPVGRHGGARNQWSGVLNYAFLDGHAESLLLRDAYASPQSNLFNPDVAR